MNDLEEIPESHLSKLKKLAEQFEDLRVEASTFFELSDIPLAIASLEGCFIKVNDAWTKVTGWSFEELTSRPYTEFIHPDDIPDTDDATEALNQDKVIDDFENRYKKKGGGYVILSWHAKYVHSTGYVYGMARVVGHED